MRPFLFFFVGLLSLTITAQINTVSVGDTYSNYVKIIDVYNSKYTTKTVVKLEFYPKTGINATLHPPSGKSPFVLTDKKGNRYALKSQSGWGGTLKGGFGSLKLNAYEKKVVRLYFNSVKNISDIYSMTEVDCSGRANCWNFYDIKVTKKTTNTSSSTSENSLKLLPVITYDKTWLDQDVFENNKFGVKIHNKFNINHLKGVRCYLKLRFMEDGSFIKTNNSVYKNSAGQLELKKALRPKFEKTIFNDTHIFLPYKLLSDQFSVGKHTIKIDVDIYRENGSLLKHLGFKTFTYIKR